MAVFDFDEFFHCISKAPERGELLVHFEGNQLCFEWRNKTGEVLCSYKSEPLSPEQVIERAQQLVKLTSSLARPDLPKDT